MTPQAIDRDELVENNMWLVKSIAWNLRPWRQPEEDVMQSGIVGLLRAAKDFDTAFGCELSTIAYPHIMFAILQSEAKDRPIYVPPKDKRNNEKVYKANAKQARRVKSLAGFKREPTIARDECDAAERIDLFDAVQFLPSREREIVERSVIDDETLTSLAAEYGVTKQAVHQSKRKALGRLRAMLASYGEN